MCPVLAPSSEYRRFSLVSPLVRRLPLLLVLVLVAQMTGCGLIEKDDKSPGVVEKPQPLGDVEFDPAWSPSGEWIAFGHYPDGIHTLHTSTGARHYILPRGLYPAWSPSGGSVAAIVFGENQVYAVDISAGTVDTLTAGPHLKIYPAWHPDGLEIAYEVPSPSEVAGIWLYQVDTHSARRVIAGGAHYPRWSPNGTTLTYIRTSSESSYLALSPAPFTASEDLVDVKSLGAYQLRSPSFSPDGTQILFSTTPTAEEEASIWVFDVNTRATRRLLLGGYYASWSPDGSHLVYVRHVEHSLPAEGNGYLWTLNLATGEQVQLTSQYP